MTPPDLHVEQVGGGAAGYLWRLLQTALGQEATDLEAPDLEALDLEAGTPGHGVYAVIEGPVVLGLAVLRLPPGSAEGTVEVLGTLPGRDDVREALLGRAFHDAAAAGVHGLHTNEA